MGDRIVSINGSETADILDFQVQSAEEDLCFEIEREGELYEVEIERSFESLLVSNSKTYDSEAVIISVFFALSTRCQAV